MFPGQDRATWNDFLSACECRAHSMFYFNPCENDNNLLINGPFHF